MFRRHGHRILQQELLNLHRLNVDEQGSFAIGHIYWVTVFSALIAMLFNIGFSTKERNEIQRPATAISHPVGVWRARGMNVLSAHQHLQGEVVSLIIVHHAIGGDELDANRVGDTSKQDRNLDRAWKAAQAAGANTPYYRDVRQEVRAGAMLLRANRSLKEMLTRVYWAKATAKLMQKSKFPPVVAAGVALEKAMDLLETQIGLEWRALRNLYDRARELLPVKRDLISRYLPAARDQMNRILDSIPKLTQQTANELASRYGVKVFVPENDRSLPVVVDPYAKLQGPPPGYVPPTDCDCPSVPADNPRYQMVKTSQLARASFPWVVFHRSAIMGRLIWRAPLSHAAAIYEEETAGQARVVLDRLQAQRNLGLYVLPGKVAPDKGWEDWTKAEKSQLADSHFTSMVLTGQYLETPMGAPFIFSEPAEKHWVRWDAVMLINDNPQHPPQQKIDLLGCKRIVPDEQARVGYDTLAWDQSRGRLPELVAGGWPNVFPRIKNGWNYTPSMVTDFQNSRIKNLPLPDWAKAIREVLPNRLEQ
jgi:hypothetical protein